MKTKILSLFLFAALLLAAVGCGSAQAETAETPVPAETEPADVSAAPEETGSGPAEAPAAGGEDAETPAQPEPDTPTEAGPDTPAETSSGEVGAPAPAVAFVTEDLDGNIWDESCFAGHKLTMINFWEPWCGPCVSEMPELQRLSEEYADRGFQLLGVFSTPGDDDVLDVLERTGVRYPILRYVSEFDLFQTGYVPTTVFFDENGQILNGVIGAHSYEDWAQLIEELL